MLKIKKTLAIAVLLCFSPLIYAENRNPATINYVDAAIKKNAYIAGTGISISGSVISATGQIIPYTGTGAINVNASNNVISSVFQNSNSILVDNNAATIKGNYTGVSGILVDNDAGTITGYTAGTGIKISGSVISAIGENTPYTGTGAINVNASNNVISSVFQNSNSILVDNNAATIKGNYTGVSGILVDNDAGTITGYTAGAGIDIKDAVISAAGGVAIGDVVAGGVVIYVNPNGTEGLVLAITEQASGAKLQYSANAAEYANASGLGGGLMNTSALLANITSNANADNSAAFAASTWFAQNDGQSLTCTTPVTAETTCYGGWFLPSIYEWQYITGNITTINDTLSRITGGTPLLDDYYWSSTGAYATGSGRSDRAYLMNPYAPNNLIVQDITSFSGYVRAMRKFYV
ncbi:MAG: hypothetical protein P1U61_07030 [Legionellaceae bacterium]|nr:hypothetical protein [Legionellaceae bacterium]